MEGEGKERIKEEKCLENRKRRKERGAGRKYLAIYSLGKRELL